MDLNLELYKIEQITRLKRRELQKLCKANGIKANSKNVVLVKNLQNKLRELLNPEKLKKYRENFETHKENKNENIPIKFAYQPHQAEFAKIYNALRLIAPFGITQNSVFELIAEFSTVGGWISLRIKTDGRSAKTIDRRTFVRNFKDTQQIKWNYRKINCVIRDIYQYKSNTDLNIKTIRNNYNKRIHINRSTINTQCELILNQDTMYNLTQYFILNYWLKRYKSLMRITKDIKYCIFSYFGDIHPIYPPVFIPTMKSRINTIDLSKHYANCQSIVFLVIHYKEYNDFYEKYKSQSNFFFVTHNEYSITLIRQCIKFMITSHLFHTLFDTAFYYECDDDAKQFKYAQYLEETEEWHLESIEFNICLELLYKNIQSKGDDAIILSVSPLRRFMKYHGYRGNKFAASTKCSNFKIVRICDELKNVNYASPEMLKIPKSEWEELREKLENQSLDKKIQKQYFQGEDFGLCEQLAVSTKQCKHKGKIYEALFRAKTFIFQRLGVSSEYNVKSGCKTI